MSRALVISVLATFVAVIALAACRPGREEAKGGGTEHGAEEIRIVAMSPALAEILRDLGLRERLVGRHGFDAWTDQDVTVCGDQAGVDVEMLLAVRPTHVLFQDEPPAEVVRLGERYGWHVRGWPLLTLDEVRRCVVDLCAQFEGEVEAETCAAVVEAFDRAMSPPPQADRDPHPMRVLLMTGVDPPTVVGPGSFHHQMLERIGGRPAMTEGSRYMVLSAEDVLAVNPDAIILFRPAGSEGESGATSAGFGIEALGPLARLDIEAVRSGRVAVIDDPMGFVPGTNLTRLAEEMRGVLEAWETGGG